MIHLVVHCSSALCLFSIYSGVAMVSAALLEILAYYSRAKNKWDYKGLEIIASHWSLPDAAREILTF